MTGVTLPGLDGSNPLAFLAALGVLNTVSDAAVPEHLKGSGHTSPDGPASLHWRDDGVWHPTIRAPFGSPDELLELLVGDLRSWTEEQARQLSYSKGRTGRAKQAKEAWDLKPPPEAFRSFSQRLASAATSAHRRSVDFLASFATETATDNNGNTKPTALHFTAGQQEFLRQVDGLVRGVTVQDLREALFGPWSYARPLPVLGWDATTTRDYALRADDPSKNKKQGVPGADWLAFRGLSFFPVAARGSSVLTTGCHGGWKDGRFRWPLWTVALERATVHTLLQLPGFGAPDDRSQPTLLTGRERRIRGIGAVFECAIRRSDQGGYGSFSAPSRV